MQEELSLYGNERNWLNTWFSLGIMIGSVPAQTSQLSFVRTSILLPTCELIWSALVIGMGFAKNIKTVSAVTKPLDTPSKLTYIGPDVRSALLHRPV